MAPKWPQICLKWPQRVQSDFQNHLHWNYVPLAVILSGHINSLRQIWVQGHKLVRNDPQNGLKWPQRVQSDFRNHLHRNSAPLAVVLSGHLTSLRQVWVRGHKLVQSGCEMAPKWPQNCLNWPQRVQSDFWNHLHWNSAPFAVILSGHMTSLRQIWVAPNCPKMTKNGLKLSRRPKMIKKSKKD